MLILTSSSLISDTENKPLVFESKSSNLIKEVGQEKQQLHLSFSSPLNNLSASNAEVSPANPAPTIIRS